MPTGHPDFLSYATWRGPALANQNYSITSATPMQFNGYVVHFSSLQVKVNVGAGQGITFGIAYFTDSTFATLIGSNSWSLWNCDLSCIVPVLGPYASVQISTTNAGAQAGQIYVAPLNVPTPVPRYSAGFNQISGNAESVAASATNSHQLTEVIEGTAYLTATPADATGKLNLQLVELDAAGTNQGILMEANGFTAPVMLQSACGRRVLQLNITNTDAAGPHVLAYRVKTITQ